MSKYDVGVLETNCALYMIGNTATDRNCLSVTMKIRLSMIHSPKRPSDNQVTGTSSGRVFLYPWN
jgi:hypothetical protein